jgi:hypothetical protein
VCGAAEVLHAAGPGPADTFACPRCRSLLNAADIRRAAEYRTTAQQAQRYADAVEAAAQQAAADALRAANTAAAWARAADEAQARARESAVPQGPPAPAPAPVPAPAPAKRGVPTALLLQGTGALMILGAAVLVSVVAWTFLPPTGQAVLLVGMVAVLGAITVAVRTRVPATSTVLAVLTAAVAVVVAVAMPAVVPTVDVRPYAAVAAPLLSALLLVSGRLAGVAVWHHLGWASIPVSMPVAAWSLLSAWGSSSVTWAVGTAVLAAGSAALVRVAVRQFRNDAETAATALWAGFALLATATIAAVVSLLWTAAAAAEEGVAERLWTAGALTAVASALGIAVQAAPAVRGAVPGVWMAAPMPLAVAVAVAPPTVPTPGAALLLPAILLLELAAGAVLLRRSGGAGPTAAAAVAWSAGALVATPLWLLLVAVFLPQRGGWFWLQDLLVSLLVGAALVAWGGYRRRAAPTVAGAAVAAAGWTAAWLAGNLGGQPESLTLPLVALILLTDLPARRRIPDWPVPLLATESAVLLCGAPTWATALDGYAGGGPVQAARLAVVAGLVGVGAALGWSVRWGRTVAAAAGAGAIGSFALAGLSRAGVDLPEAYTAVVALALAAVAAAAKWEGATHRTQFGPALATLLAPSLMIAVADPRFTLEWAVLRGILLLAALGGLAVRLRRRSPRMAFLTVSCGLLLLCWWWGWWVAGSAAAGVVEAWTIPWAVMATADVALWLRATAGGVRKVQVLLPAAVALAASTLTSLIRPLGGSGGDSLRVAVVLVVLWLLAFAVRRRPVLLACAGGGAIAFTWFQVVQVVAGRYPGAGVEVFTWSGAVALAAVSALAVRAARQPVPTWLSMGPAAALALLPTAALAWSSGQLTWRVWFVLIAAGALLAAGVHLGWAGLVYPSLVAIAAIVIPVLTRLAQDLPAYVPLSLVGGALVVLGARLEAVRRRGRELGQWTTRLH